MLLKDRFCVVTGGAGGRSIGRAAAVMFAEHGATVAILDLNSAGAKSIAADLPDDNNHRGFGCDVTDFEQCAAVLQDFQKQTGRIDVVLNCAGVAEPTAFSEITPRRYDLMMDVNLRGTFNVCQAAAQHMLSTGTGSIINISSVAAQRGGGVFGGAHYAAAKGGVLSLTKALARELAPRGIRVNAICPSLVETDIHGDGLSEDRRKELVAAIPLGRVGQPRDIAGVSLFLASELSSYVTGAVIDVNGGSHIH